MYLRVRGPDLVAPVARALAATTDHARLRIPEVRYDANTQTASLPLLRASIRARGRLPGFKYDTGQPTRSILRIENVVSCRIEQPPADCDDQVELLFGFTVDGLRIYACSAAEHRGKPCFEIELEVSEIDVELADEAEGAGSR